MILIPAARSPRGRRRVGRLRRVRVACALAAVASITAQRLAVERLRRQAFHDPLTGLANRALFSAEAARALARRGGQVVAVLVCDIDGFKGVNDAYGHPAGDELLVAVAGRLAGAVRPSDLVARFGGDEFAVLLDDLPGDEDAGAFAGRVVDAVSALFPVAGGTVSIGVSVGVAVARSGSGAGLGRLVGEADRALYAAKAAGKRTWRAAAPGLPAAPPAAAGHLVKPAAGDSAPLLARVRGRGESE